MDIPGRETNVGRPLGFNFEELSDEKMDGFMSSAILEQHPGGHSLAMPTWTITPFLYHAPPDYDMSRRTGEPDREDEDKLIQKDGYGAFWKIDRDKRRKHNELMKSVKNHASQGLAAMTSVKFYEAVDKFDTALSELWPCHQHTPLECWIKTHRGHALLRAGLLQSPTLHGKKPSSLLKMCFVTLSECVEALQTQPSLREDFDMSSIRLRQDFDRSLLFSGLLGLAWTSLFQGNMENAEEYIVKAQTVKVNPSHFRGDRDIDTLFFRIAQGRMTGTLYDIEGLIKKFGHRISQYSQDSMLVGLEEISLFELKGEFHSAVSVATSSITFPDDLHFPNTKTNKFSKELMNRLLAGYVGNIWLALGLCREARAAYEVAYTSQSVLMQAAALVGLGNALLREAGVKPKASTSVIGEPSFADAEFKYKEAVKIYDDLGFKEGQIIAQCNLGNLHHRRKQFEEASVWYTMAKNNFGEKMDRSSAALHLHLKLAELYLEERKWDLAYESITKGSQLLPHNKSLLAMAWVEHLSGSYYMRKTAPATSNEGLSKAKQHLLSATKIYAEIQRDLGSYASLWPVVFEQQKETYALLLWCLACRSEDSKSTASTIEALVWCERSRSRVLMIERWSEFYKMVSPYLSVEADIALKATTYKEFDNLPCEENWKNLRLLLTKLKLPTVTVVEYSLCADFGFLIFVVDMPRGEPKMLRVPFEEFESGQGKDKNVGKKLDRGQLAALVDRTAKCLTSPTLSDEEELKSNLSFLYKLLIKPVEKWLKKSKQIIVIPHEVLFKVPFHALIDEKNKYLIERYTLSCAESIRSLVQCSLLWERCIHLQEDHVNSADQRHGQTSKKWLVVGINKHSPAHRDLIFAEDEARAVANSLAKRFKSTETSSSLILGLNATKDQLKKRLEGVDIIHLATHGIISTKYERGGILLATPASIMIDENVTGVVDSSDQVSEQSSAPAEPSHDMIPTRSVDDLRRNLESLNKSSMVVLSASEISSMNLEARLVVLSSCQSAEGVIMGDGVAGLGRALLLAGVPCTVLSLWPVSDKGTIEFMKNFYKEFVVPGQTVADAMKTAMVTMINAEGHYGQKIYKVRHWAAFWTFGLPIVRVSNLSMQMQVRSPQADDLGPSLTSHGRIDKLLKLGTGAVLAFGTLGAMTLAQISKSKVLTRSITSEASVTVEYAWNPLRAEKPRAPMRPITKGLHHGHMREKLMIFGHLAFHLIQCDV